MIWFVTSVDTKKPSVPKTGSLDPNSFLLIPISSHVWDILLLCYFVSKWLLWARCVKPFCIGGELGAHRKKRYCAWIWKWNKISNGMIFLQCIAARTVLCESSPMLQGLFSCNIVSSVSFLLSPLPLLDCLMMRLTITSSDEVCYAAAAQNRGILTTLTKLSVEKHN